ncbi:MAG: hypothetical protein JJU27_17340 [Gammaproteobacteria bacterium]|nr:hypothetical protein [Gammaproteobacteria bacterium]
MLLAALALTGREGAASVTLGWGGRPLLGLLAVVLAGVAVLAALMNLLSGGARSGRFFRVLLVGIAALLLTLAWLVEYRIVDARRVVIDGVHGPLAADLVAPRGAGPFAAALVLPSSAGADVREARMLARYLAERGIVALAADVPAGDTGAAGFARADVQSLFARLVEASSVDPVRSGVISIGESASAAIADIELATFLVVRGVQGDPGLDHWADVHVPVLLLTGGRGGADEAEARLDHVGSQLTAMTQAETDALVFADGDAKLRRSALRFARGYPRVVAGWIHLVFRLPEEPGPIAL